MEIISPSYEIFDPVDGEAILNKLELWGRVAHKSEDKVTPVSARVFIRKLIDMGHESVIEHVFISVKFICDRGVTHELVRHRLVSFTQESTRYCDYSKSGVTFIRPVFWDSEEESEQYRRWKDAMLAAEAYYNALISHGASPEKARTVLPNSTKTEIVTTANLREWRHILRQRTSKAAHPQMRQLMIPLLNDFKRLIPVIFDDIEVTYDTKRGF